MKCSGVEWNANARLEWKLQWIDALTTDENALTAGRGISDGRSWRSKWAELPQAGESRQALDHWE